MVVIDISFVVFHYLYLQFLNIINISNTEI